MTAGPSGSKLAAFLLRLCLSIARHCPTQGERNLNRLPETGGAERRQKPNTDNSKRLLCCLQRKEFATFSGKVRTESG